MLEHIEFTLNLIRHAESEINADPDLMGQTHTTFLTEKGKQQAQKLHNRFIKNNEYFDRIYCSPYTRAIDTCQIVIPNRNQQVIIAPDLREYDPGDWVQKKISDTITPEIRRRMDVLNQNFLPPNGESETMVERRASAWLEKEILYNKEMMKEFQRVQAPLNIACFSHGKTIKCLLHYIMGFDKSFSWKISITNTSISRLSFGKDGWKLLNINDCYHLEN